MKYGYKQASLIKQEQEDIKMESVITKNIENLSFGTENDERQVFGGELSPLCELRKSNKGAVSLDCFSVSFTDSIELLCFLSESEK